MPCMMKLNLIKCATFALIGLGGVCGSAQADLVSASKCALILGQYDNEDAAIERLAEVKNDVQKFGAAYAPEILRPESGEFFVSAGEVSESTGDLTLKTLSSLNIAPAGAVCLTQTELANRGSGSATGSKDENECVVISTDNWYVAMTNARARHMGRDVGNYKDQLGKIESIVEGVPKKFGAFLVETNRERIGKDELGGDLQAIGIAVAVILEPRPANYIELKDQLEGLEQAGKGIQFKNRCATSLPQQAELDSIEREIATVVAQREAELEQRIAAQEAEERRLEEQRREKAAEEKAAEEKRIAERRIRAEKLAASYPDSLQNTTDNQTLAQAYGFLLGGDSGWDAYRGYEINKCNVTFSTYGRGGIRLDVTHMLNKVIWGSDQIQLNEQGQTLIRFNCKETCLKQSAYTNNLELEGSIDLYDGINQRFLTLPLEVTADRFREALTDVRGECPGAASNY